MSTFLKTLKDRLDDAQTRAREISQRFHAAKSAAELATQRYQAVTAEWQAISQEAAGWAKSYETESKRDSDLTQSRHADVAPALAAGAPELTTSNHADDAPMEKLSEQEGTGKEEINKTELVRDVVRNHLAGITPGEVFRIVKDQIPRRNYVYSVLGRLKERDQVTVRRGKYFSKAKPVEAKTGEEAMPDN